MIEIKIGMKFGYLEVIELNRTEKRGSSWLCKCVCGNEKVYPAALLIGGERYRSVKSCGCKAYVHKGAIMKNKRLYGIWYEMIKRCYDPTADNFERYGGSGITVEDVWKNNYLLFYEWSLVNGYADDLTIDRINPEKPYSPENCRWADYYVQMQNRGLMGNNTTGVNGVSFNKKTGKYIAYIRRNDIHKNLGSHERLEEAAEARRKADEHFEKYGTIENL